MENFELIQNALKNGYGTVVFVQTKKANKFFQRIQFLPTIKKTLKIFKCGGFRVPLITVLK